VTPPRKRRNPLLGANRRIRLLIALFALVFAAALARAGWLQAIRAPTLDRLAASQHRETVQLPPHRGALFDRNGVELAIGEHATTIYASPPQIEDPRAAAMAAGRALGVAPESLLPELSARSRGFVYVARKADPAKAAVLQAERIPGFGFYPEERRTYPQHGVASEVLGYAGVDNHGLAGLELQLDRYLAGAPGTKTVVRDPSGQTLETVAAKPAVDGRDVYLTIDHVIQGQLERILRETRERWAAKAVTGVVLDPRTGGVLGMAVEPGFDANRYPQVPDDRQRNRAVTDTYEPGSTFKLVTISAELERRDVTPATTFRLQPSIQVADRVIHDAEPRPTETMSVAQILARSSNIGTITLALRLGPDKLSSWISRFGFGRPTGIDFPGESPGIVPPLDQWSGSTIATLPIGHGIAVTPIQMAAAYATIANRGVWTRPHLVDHVAGRPAAHPSRHRVLSVRTADTVRRLLGLVVQEGTGTEAEIPGYSVAGKTGTAAKPDLVHGGYSQTNYVASFVGLVPAKKPRLVILVTVDEPRGTIWGGTAAAPAFAEIAKFCLQYLEIPPDRPLELTRTGQ
jgi:cell division protein FtsI (penicillin-binding protein 3)